MRSDNLTAIKCKLCHWRCSVPPRSTSVFCATASSCREFPRRVEAEQVFSSLPASSIDRILEHGESGENRDEI